MLQKALNSLEGICVLERECGTTPKIASDAGVNFQIVCLAPKPLKNEFFKCLFKFVKIVKYFINVNGKLLELQGVNIFQID